MGSGFHLALWAAASAGLGRGAAIADATGTARRGPQRVNLVSSALAVVGVAGHAGQRAFCVGAAAGAGDLFIVEREFTRICGGFSAAGLHRGARRTFAAPLRAGLRKFDHRAALGQGRRDGGSKRNGTGQQQEAQDDENADSTRRFQRVTPICCDANIGVCRRCRMCLCSGIAKNMKPACRREKTFRRRRRATHSSGGS